VTLRADLTGRVGAPLGLPALLSRPAMESPPDDRGVLASAFWNALEKRLTDPRFLEAAEQPGFERQLSELTGTLVTEVSRGVLDTLLKTAPDVLADRRKAKHDFEATIARWAPLPTARQHPGLQVGPQPSSIRATSRSRAAER
jgi:hypothetical protein